MKVRAVRESTSGTRDAILDATEKVMRREGYAAVSSRRIAEEGGLNPSLVHYHFDSMDDVFEAVFRRMAATFFERHVAAMTAEDPLRALWEVMIDRRDMEVIGEFMALSNHRKAIRQEIMSTNQRIRTMQVSMISRALEQRGIPPQVCPPNVLAILMSGAALALVSEAALGNSAAHSETIRFVDQLLEKTFPVASGLTSKPRQRRKAG